MIMSWPTDSSTGPENVNLAHQDLVWREIKPGRWERGIDEAEEYYALLAKLYEGTGQMYFALTGYVSIRCSGPDHDDNINWAAGIDQAIREAWLILRHRHPSIASRVEWDSRKKRFVKIYETANLCPGSQELQGWLNDTFHITAGFSTGLEFANSGLPAPSYCSLHVIKPSGTGACKHSEFVGRDLVLRLPHDTIDGIGTFHLIGELLKYVSEVLDHRGSVTSSILSEVQGLAPPMKLALGMPVEPRYDVMEHFDTIALNNARLSQEVEIMTLPFKRGAKMPGKSQRAETVLSSQRTKLTLLGCKKMAVSVTHVYHAAAIIALKHLQQQRSSARTVRYVSSGWINLRDRCQSPYNSSAYAAAVYHAASPHVLAVDMKMSPESSPDSDQATAESHRATEFENVVDTVRNFYHQLSNDEDLVPLASPVWHRETLSFPQFDRPPPPPSHTPSPNPNPSVYLSSMGNIDKIISRKYGSVEVHDTWITGEELDTGLGLFLITFRDKLSLSATFNEAWHDMDEVTEFLRNCHQVAAEGLGLV